MNRIVPGHHEIVAGDNFGLLSKPLDLDPQL